MVQAARERSARSMRTATRARRAASPESSSRREARSAWRSELDEIEARNVQRRRGSEGIMPLESLQTNWWALALRGIAAIVFGVVTFIVPGITLAALVFLFAGYAFVDGLFNIIGAIRGVPGKKRSILILEGIISIAAGVLTVIWPGISAVALVYLIAAWALITGGIEIAAAFRLRKQIKGEWLLGLAGVLSIVLGVLLFARPGPGALALVYWIGGYAFIFGVALVALSFRVRTWERTHWVPTRPAPV
jgi:uncharacterized membrane protein HdeD (DUF308 family)